MCLVRRYAVKIPIAAVGNDEINAIAKVVLKEFHAVPVHKIPLSLTHSHYPITRDSLEAIKNGKILYNQYCASCHQPNLAGAANWQGLDEDGHRKAPPLNGTGHTWHHTDELLHRMIKYGFAKLIKNYEGKMMGFGDKISDEGIDNILSYIKSPIAQPNKHQAVFFALLYQAYGRIKMNLML